MILEKTVSLDDNQSYSLEDANRALFRPTSQTDEAVVESRGSFHRLLRRSVSIAWEGGGATSQQGDITDDQWEIFKLAFMTTGRIAILSELPREEALYDYRFLEAVR